MPWDDSTFPMAPKKPSGGTANPPTPWDGLGDHGGHVPRGGHVDELHEVVDAGCGVCVVVEVAERAAQPVAALDKGDVEPGEAGRRPAAVGGDGLGREGAAVVAVAHGEDLVGAAVARSPCSRAASLASLPEGSEEHPGVVDARHPGHLLGEGDHRLAQDTASRCASPWPPAPAPRPPRWARRGRSWSSAPRRRSRGSDGPQRPRRSCPRRGRSTPARRGANAGSWAAPSRSARPVQRLWSWARLCLR